ncbi:hypothetical protein QFC19_001935 [Naganishia cerealis]|uniref:Uncharacterized protein n=1 Tax=Naganishia cerealis TaxID=610337 RepID=A0ACC2WD74_9TREE|nr:hypothetical protein QFC19_001935 [Naganishia cerealis]
MPTLSGRFTGATDPLMHQYNQSLSYDQRMYAADVKGSMAHSRGLEKAGILTQQEREEIERGLKQVEKEWKEGQFKIFPDDEDIHTANERRLSEIIGKDIGGKLHTGRSRNDQVATDMRIWLMDEVENIKGYLKDLILVMANRAEKEVDAIMPGYTHVQFLRQQLGFEALGENSMHIVPDRDFVIEFLQWSSLMMIHMSKMAEDFIIYSTAEFGFIQLSDAYSTGSSIMPQKKNPDSLELLRGKSGRVFGQMAGFMMSVKGTPSTYNKDLQEDKEPLFDCVDTVANSIRIAEGVIATLSINPEKMLAALTDDMLATDLADYLVRKGVPFRETHHISGRAVALAEKQKCNLSDITFEQYRELSDKFEPDVIESVFNFENSVEKRDAVGGPSRKGIERQVQFLKSGVEKL